MPGNYYSFDEGVAAGIYDAPGTPGAVQLQQEIQQLKTGPGELGPGEGLTPTPVKTITMPGAANYNTPPASQITVAPGAKSDTLAASGQDQISPGQSKLNGWLNYLSGQITGKPSGNTGDQNPAGPDSPAGSAVIDAFSSGNWLNRLGVILLGLVFVGAGLFGLTKTS